MSARLSHGLVAAALIVGTCGAYAQDAAPNPADVQQVANAACREIVQEMRAMYATKTVPTPSLDQINYENLLGPIEASCRVSLVQGLTAK